MRSTSFDNCLTTIYDRRRQLLMNYYISLCRNSQSPSTQKQEALGRDYRWYCGGCDSRPGPVCSGGHIFQKIQTVKSSIHPQPYGEYGRAVTY